MLGKKGHSRFDVWARMRYLGGKKLDDGNNDDSNGGTNKGER